MNEYIELMERTLSEWVKEYPVEWIEQAYKNTVEEPRKGHCKDCKWWKDSDGTYRRGIKAESQCPINRKEVYEGNGYCFLYEPQESEDKG